jgi:hypothetical protein
MERAMLLLSLFARKYPSITVPTFLEVLNTDLELQGVSYSSDFGQVHTLLKVLDADRLIEVHDSNRTRLTARGLLKAEELGSKAGIGDQGFVAMSFAPELREVWSNGFDRAIRAAGYSPFRIDEKDFIGGITDENIAEIRRPRFVVADYTEHKNGVYFEAGFALGLGLSVIHTVRADHVASLHFDIKHLKTLVWQSPSDLAEKLERRIRAVIGDGPRVLL